MIASTINLTIFIIMIIIYFNELKNVSMFILNFNYIRDLSKIIMEQKCNNIYCEAETDRYKISQSSYELLQPNDIFNAKTYIILIFIISILIFLYYYNRLFAEGEIWNKITAKNEIMLRVYVYSLHFFLMAILILIIAMRYVPYDEAGYLNYFKDNNLNDSFNAFIILAVSIIFIIVFTLINKSDFKQLIIAFCFIFSLTLLINLLNIVLSFRNNTKPILKTKELRWSLKNSLKNIMDKYGEIIGPPPHLVTVFDDMIVKLHTSLGDGDEYSNAITRNNVSYIINILIAFNELINIHKKYNDSEIHKKTIDRLKTKIKQNYESFDKINKDIYKPTTHISDLSLIFDKEVRLPADYNSDEHKNNANSMNDEYVYTADISYDNPNLFYEKYWNIKEFGYSNIYPAFLQDYSYYTPRLINYIMDPNLYNIWILIIGFIISMVLIPIFFKWMDFNIADNDISYVISAETLQFLYQNLVPLITFCILIIYILIFISFNTSFNKYVVYKCLDSSYKRSLNKLNNIVTPYIRLYDNKKKTGNKNYLHHYIIANVFYSLLRGYIKLVPTSEDAEKIKKSEGYDSIISASREIKKLYDQINALILDDNMSTSTVSKYKAKYTSKISRNAEFTKINEKCNPTSLAITFLNNALAKYTVEVDKNINDILVPIKTKIQSINTKLDGMISLDYETVLLNVQLLRTNIGSIHTSAKNAYKEITSTIELAKPTKITKASVGLTSSSTKDETDYISTFNLKVKNYKFANMNNNILNNDNIFKEYYKKLFSNIYKPYVNGKKQDLYEYLEKILEPHNVAITTASGLTTYLENNIYNNDNKNLKTIYNIIQRCIDLFDENQFNNNLSDYNNPKSKKDGIDNYNEFQFYNKNSNKILPYQFILKLGSADDVKQFISGNLNKMDESEVIELKSLLTFDEDPYISMEPDVNNKNLQKIIAKFLLILCHINYNKYNYIYAVPETGVTVADKQQQIYERKTEYLYRLFSNTLYNDTYVIDDTFVDITAEEKKGLITSNLQKPYYNLTYIYNYLETKYVNISSNNNNNYLMNIIKSINKKINDDDKIFNDGSKDAQYIFANYMNKSKDFDNEEEILNIANNISTTSFGITYAVNMIFLLIYYYLVLKK
jgi:hypothetical protein